MEKSRGLAIGLGVGMGVLLLTTVLFAVLYFTRTESWTVQVGPCVDDKNREIACGEGKLNVQLACVGGKCGPRPSVREIKCTSVKGCAWETGAYELAPNNVG